MNRKEDTPQRIIRRKYEEKHKDERQAAHKVWGTSVDRSLANEIDDFLIKHNIKKVELIYAGFKALQNQYRRVLRTLFNEAVRYEWIAKNPVCSTKIGAGSSNTSLRAVPEKEVFSFAETREFISKLNELAPEDIYKKIPIKLMLLMGMRTAEVCGLRWSDIDFKKKTIRVNRNRLYTKEFGIYEKEPKTATSLRDIPMPDALINDLIIYMEWFRQADALFDERLDEYYLAVNVYRLPIFPQSIGQYLKRYERQWGMKEVTCHGLLHTYCSLLLSQNVPIQTVSKYMGHSDSTVTLKVYSHFIPDTQDTALTALNNIME